jgi:hypothetical protein
VQKLKAVVERTACAVPIARPFVAAAVSRVGAEKAVKAAKTLIDGLDSFLGVIFEEKG